MRDTTLTEEQKQVKQLLNRWGYYFMRYFTGVLVLIVAPIWVIILANLARENLAYFALVIPFYIAFLIGYKVSYSRFLRKCFVRKMTEDEGEMLYNSLNSGHFTDREQPIILRLIQEYNQVNPKMEYLRASEEPQYETLLRAAQNTDTTPQDQLLRPAPTADK